MGKQAFKTRGMPNWVDCATTDLATAEEFYAAVFGWTAERVKASDGSVYSLQRLDGKMVAGLYELSDELRGMGVPPHWGTYFEVDDVDSVLKAAAGAGGRVVEDPIEEPGVGKIGIIQDNVGAFARIWTSAPEHGGEVFNVAGALIWNELCTREPAKAAEFYEKVLGLTAETMQIPNPYILLKANARVVAGVLQITAEMGEMPPSWDVYFGAEDVDATTAAARAAGGTVLREPFDIAGGQARMAVLQDPTGAVFELMSLELANM